MLLCGYPVRGLPLGTTGSGPEKGPWCGTGRTNSVRDQEWNGPHSHRELIGRQRVWNGRTDVEASVVMRSPYPYAGGASRLSGGPLNGMRPRPTRRGMPPLKHPPRASLAHPPPPLLRGWRHRLPAVRMAVTAPLSHGPLWVRQRFFATPEAGQKRDARQIWRRQSQFWRAPRFLTTNQLRNGDDTNGHLG